DLDEDFKPCLTELNDISFGRQTHHPTMRIPEFVLHSRALDRYVAFKMPPAREIESYIVPYKPMVRPRRRSGDTSHALDSRIIFLSFMPTRNSIPVFADIYECTRTSPDWMLGYIGRRELADGTALNQAKQRFNDFKPARGYSLIVVEQGVEPEAEKMPEGVNAVAAGFDTAKILEIVKTMKASIV
ncbi:MAG TPA: hypothetical protein VLL97_10280, partial [Acidobacteriota bacterium]|nr:hypothetical protein [Acidobacteriota bacterium]